MALTITDNGVIIPFNGLLLVFGILLLLVIALLLIGKMIADARRGGSNTSLAADTGASQDFQIASPAAAEEGELIAVIAAAVSALYEGTGKQYAVRSVKPAGRSGSRPVWATAGVWENTRPF